MSYVSRLPVRVRGAFGRRASGRHRNGPVNRVAGPVSAARVWCPDVEAGRERRSARRGQAPSVGSRQPESEAHGEWFPPLSREEPGTLVRPYVVGPSARSGGERDARGAQ